MPQAIQSTPEHRVYSKAELTEVRRNTLRYARSFPPGPERNFHRQVALSLRSLFKNEAWLEAHTIKTKGARVAWGHHLNDDKSPLIGLLTCTVCNETMKLEKSAANAEGKDIIQYRCERCDRIERVRLFRRSRDAAG